MDQSSAVERRGSPLHRLHAEPPRNRDRLLQAHRMPARHPLSRAYAAVGRQPRVPRPAPPAPRGTDPSCRGRVSDTRSADPDRGQGRPRLLGERPRSYVSMNGHRAAACARPPGLTCADAGRTRESLRPAGPGTHALQMQEPVNKATRVLIVDDHAIVREGLRALLDHSDWLESAARPATAPRLSSSRAGCARMW